jgi:pimeloyl-ACP methyl ester carboxylesterase
MISLVALHGNGGGGERFALLDSYVPPDITLHCPTLPGFGGTGADKGLVTMADWGRAVLRLAEELPAPRVLFGHGIGGSFVLEALRHDTRHGIAGVVLLAPVGANLDSRRFPALMRPRTIRTLGKHVIAWPMLRPLFRRLLFTQRLPDDVEDRFFDAYPSCAVFEQMFDLITAPWFSSLPPFPHRSVILWGGKERVITADQHTAFRAVLPNADVQIVDRWGHFPMLEQPEDCMAVLASAVRRVVA